MILEKIWEYNVMLLIKESISLFYWIIIILIAPKIFKRDLELRRKFVHIMIANWWFIAIIFLTDLFMQALCR